MSKPKMISLFTGAGGMDYGFEAAGFETAVALENDPACCKTIEQNRSQWNLIPKSIFHVKPEELLEKGRLKKGKVELLIGGPPCQPFSKSGYWAQGDSARLKDPRARTLRSYMHFVEKTLPYVFVLENVTGLAFSQKDEGLRMLLRCIERINARTGSKYVPHYKVLNAAWYGVPQLRQRFILVASSEGAFFDFPEPTHTDPLEPAPSLFDVRLKPYCTAWDAIGDLQPESLQELAPTGKWAALLPSIPEGKNYLHHTSRGEGKPLFGWRTRYWTFLLKLAKNRPAWTIQAQPGPSVGPFHWNNRRLSIQELARLQTFPKDIQIYGNRQSAQRQLGNAVPSLLAEVLGRAIQSQLLGLSPPKEPPTLLPPVRSPIPSAEAPSPVPRKYWTLIGKHADHPGTGQGPRSISGRS